MKLCTPTRFFFFVSPARPQNINAWETTAVSARLHTQHTHTHTPTHTFSLHPHHITMSSSDFLLPEKWSEGLLDEAGAPMSKTCV